MENTACEFSLQSLSQVISYKDGHWGDHSSGKSLTFSWLARGLLPGPRLHISSEEVCKIPPDWRLHYNWNKLNALTIWTWTIDKNLQERLCFITYRPAFLGPIQTGVGFITRIQFKSNLLQTENANMQTDYNFRSKPCLGLRNSCNKIKVSWQIWINYHEDYYRRWTS